MRNDTALPLQPRANEPSARNDVVAPRKSAGRRVAKPPAPASCGSLKLVSAFARCQRLQASAEPYAFAPFHLGFRRELGGECGSQKADYADAADAETGIELRSNFFFKSANLGRIARNSVLSGRNAPAVSAPREPSGP